MSPLQVVAPNTALKLRALRDCKDETSQERQAGDEWLFKGPGTYVPRIEQQVVEIVRATLIGPNQALRLRAKKEFADKKTGEEWLVRVAGAYMPSVYEEIVATIAAVVLTDKKALHLRAQRTFTDHYGQVLLSSPPPRPLLLLLPLSFFPSSHLPGSTHSLFLCQISLLLTSFLPFAHSL